MYTLPKDKQYEIKILVGRQLMARNVAPARSRRKALFTLVLALLVLAGLILGAFIVLGSQSARLAGVNHLEQLDYECVSVFQAATYYQSECQYEGDGSGWDTYTPSPETIEADTDTDTEENYDYALGEYPWIWEPEAALTHLDPAASRLRLLDWRELHVEFDFVTGALATDEQTYWLVDDDDAWRYFLATDDTVCAQAEDVEILTTPLTSTLAFDQSSQDMKSAVATITALEYYKARTEYYYCVEVRYTEDSGVSENRVWVKFRLPLDEMSQQVEERQYVNEAARIVGLDRAAAIAATHISLESRLARMRAAAHVGWLPSAASSDADDDVSEEIAGFDGSYVDIGRVVVELPEGWNDFSRRQKEEANPYGCWRRLYIDEESGRCLDEAQGYELIGYDGTPDWLTVDLPPGWTTAGEQEKILDNPYGCFDSDAIQAHNGRCSSGQWVIWSYIFSEDVTEELEDDRPSYADVQLYVQTFEDADDKEAYFVANSDVHPCQTVLDAGGGYVIIGNLYIIYADATSSDEDDAWQTLFVRFSEEDSDAVLYDVLTCQSRIETLEQLALSCQQSGSAEGACADSGLDNKIWAAVTAVGATCQEMYDNIGSRGADRPDAGDMANCLLLTELIRQDFIDNIQIVTPTDGSTYEIAQYWGGGGVYDGEYPYVAWNDQTEFSFYGQNTRFQIEKVALHEYMHKFYHLDLSVKERMRWHQEVLALYENKQKVLFGYLGESDLRGEVQSRIGRHSSADQGLLDLDSTIEEVNSLSSQIIEALPAEAREEYGEFLNDRHGIVAFVYASAEVSVEEFLKETGSVERLFTSTLDPDLAEEVRRVIVEASNSEQSVGQSEPLASRMSSILPGLRENSLRSDGYQWASAGAEEEQDEQEYTTSDSDDGVPLESSTTYLIGMFFSLRGFFVEGYPILALETAHSLSPGLEGHYNQYFNRQNLTRYFEYHPPLSFEPGLRQTDEEPEENGEAEEIEAI